MMMLYREDLHPYQERCVQLILEKRKCLLGVEMGLGKTAATLTAIKELRDSMMVSKILIIAPLRVATSVWHTEAKKWGHLQKLTFSICTGAERDRVKSLLMGADIHVINRENVAWLVHFYGDKFPFDCVIVDESSSFKNHTSMRFKKLRKVSTLTNYMVLLSGTPSPNGYLDLWAQLFLIDAGHRLGRTISQYKRDYFTTDEYVFGKTTLKNGMGDAIQDKIKDVFLSLRAEDYLDLPEKIFLNVNVNFQESLKKRYDDFKKNLIMGIGPDEIVATNAAVLVGKLLQFSNGAVYIDESKRYQTIHDLKIDALREIIDENPDENIIVAYQFKSDLERLKMAFPHAIHLTNDSKIIEKWNERKIKMLLAHPASCGHGLNLQGGGSIAVWFGVNWSLELYAQFNARLHRQGQKQPVKIIHIIGSGTVDNDVLDALEKKTTTQDALLDALKMHLFE